VKQQLTFFLCLLWRAKIDNKFDAAYEIDATAHAPDKVGCYKEVLRVLKPGQPFAGYEWCLTDSYDPENPVHQEIKKGIEEGKHLFFLGGGSFLHFQHLSFTRNWIA